MDSLMTKKRQEIFQILENKKAQIILLQEKHFNSQLRKKWEKKWKDLSFWHSGKKNKIFRCYYTIPKTNKNRTNYSYKRQRWKNTFPKIHI